MTLKYFKINLNAQGLDHAERMKLWNALQGIIESLPKKLADKIQLLERNY